MKGVQAWKNVIKIAVAIKVLMMVLIGCSTAGDSGGEENTIVSLIPSNTEIAFALGLEDQIVGVSDFCNYPEAALSKEKVGGMEIDVEKILSLAPDQLLISAYHQTAYEEVMTQFEEAGIQVIVIQDAFNFDDVYAAISQIGEVTGTEAKAEEIISSMQDRLADVQEKANEVTEVKTVWVEVDEGLFTTGQGSFMHEMLAVIKAENVAGNETGWVQMNEESVVAANPNVIIATYGGDATINEIQSRSGWQEVDAVVQQQVFIVNDDLVSRPGPRLIDGVEEFAKHIYPEIFN